MIENKPIELWGEGTKSVRSQSNQLNSRTLRFTCAFSLLMDLNSVQGVWSPEFSSSLKQALSNFEFSWIQLPVSPVTWISCVQNQNQIPLTGYPGEGVAKKNPSSRDKKDFALITSLSRLLIVHVRSVSQYREFLSIQLSPESSLLWLPPNWVNSLCLRNNWSWRKRLGY